VRLILLAAVLTAGALAATVLVWRRWGRWRFLIRPCGVLLVEALLMLTVGLVVNRSQQFYPSWAALFATSDPGPTAYHTSAGRLDAWLATQPSVRTFPWRPSGWTSWHLAGAPTVTVPLDYLEHPSWRYSVVVVMGPRPWSLPGLDGPTVVVDVTTTAGTSASVLAVGLPVALGRDLRVSGHRWALVTAAGDGVLARQVAISGRGRFPAIAFVGVAGPGRAARAAHGTLAARPGHGVGATTAGGTDKSAPAVHRPTAVHRPPASKSAGNRPTVHLPPGVLPSGIQAAYFPDPVSERAPTDPLKAALQWAAAQTPLPLAASAPEPTYLPPAPKRPHHHAKPKPKAVTHGPRQPRP
jgi:hypothetical protein